MIFIFVNCYDIYSVTNFKFFSCLLIHDFSALLIVDNATGTEVWDIVVAKAAIRSEDMILGIVLRKWEEDATRGVRPSQAYVKFINSNTC